MLFCYKSSKHTILPILTSFEQFLLIYYIFITKKLPWKCPHSANIKKCTQAGVLFTLSQMKLRKQLIFFHCVKSARKPKSCILKIYINYIDFDLKVVKYPKTKPPIFQNHNVRHIASFLSNTLRYICLNFFKTWKFNIFRFYHCLDIGTGLTKS